MRGRILILLRIVTADELGDKVVGFVKEDDGLFFFGFFV